METADDETFGAGAGSSVTLTNVPVSFFTLCSRDSPGFTVKMIKYKLFTFNFLGEASLVVVWTLQWNCFYLQSFVSD